MIWNKPWFDVTSQTHIENKQNENITYAQYNKLNVLTADSKINRPSPLEKKLTLKNSYDFLMLY